MAEYECFFGHKECKHPQHRSEAEAALAEAKDGFKGFIEETERLHKAEVYGLKTLLAEARKESDGWHNLYVQQTEKLAAAEAKCYHIEQVRFADYAEAFHARIASLEAAIAGYKVLEQRAYAAEAEVTALKKRCDTKNAIIVKYSNDIGALGRALGSTQAEVARLKAAKLRYYQAARPDAKAGTMCGEPWPPTVTGADRATGSTTARPDAAKEALAIWLAHEKPKRKRRRSK